MDRMKCVAVVEGYATALGEAMPLVDHWRMVDQAISTASEHKICRLPRREKKEWFDEECRRALSEKNVARARMLRHETRQHVENYR